MGIRIVLFLCFIVVGAIVSEYIDRLLGISYSYPVWKMSIHYTSYGIYAVVAWGLAKRISKK